MIKNNLSHTPKIKKTCGRCKAVKVTVGGGMTCTLGYKVDNRKWEPLEICPKPMTYLQLNELRKES